jgi:hypothetical protein
LLLHLAEAALIFEFAIDIPMDRLDPPLLLFLYFQLGETLLLYHDLVLHLIILVDSHIDLCPA